MSKELEAWKETRENYLQLKKEKYYKCKELSKILNRCNNRCDIIENALKDFEWLKSVISIDMFEQLPTPEDKIRFLKIMGVEL